MTTAATLAARLILDSSSYNKGLTQAQAMTKKFESSLSTIGSKMTSLGGMMSATFTLPIVGGATLAAKAYQDLDTQMQNIQSIATDLNDVQLYQLRQRFIEMSTDLNVTRDTATGLAEAFYFIQSAGFAGEDGMTVLTAATKAATAGLTDTMVAGNAIIATLNAYGMGAEKASYVSDVLFKTVDLGVITFEELATQLGDVVNTAAMTSVPIADVGAAMVMMTRKGVSASESVTALNQLLLQFISPSKKMKDQAEEWGVAMDVSTLRTYGLAGALDLIIQKGGGTDALLTLFGDNVRALKGALTIAGDGVEEFTAIQQQFGDVTGRTQEAFLIQNKSVGAQLDNFKNKLTEVGLTMAELFLPFLLELIDDYLIPLIDWFMKLPGPVKFWTMALLALVAVIGPLLVVLGMMATALSAIIALITTIGLPVLLLVGLIFVLIAALVFLYIAWNNNWYGIRDVTDAAVMYLINIINYGLAWIRAFFSGELGQWSVAFTNAWNHIKLIFATAISNIQLLFKAWGAAFRGDWYSWGMYVRMIWDNMWRLLIQTINVSFQNMVIVVRQIINWIVGLFQSVNWGGLGANIGNGIYNGLVSVANRIINLARSIANAVAQAWAGFWGIHSPSSLAEYYARMVGEGWNREMQGTQWYTIGGTTTDSLGTPSTNLAPMGEGATSDAEIVSLLRQLVAKDGLDTTQLARQIRDAVLAVKD